jgi:GNAT superfamily N-acetyltransferase
VAETLVRALGPDDLADAGRIIYRAFSRSFRRYGYAEPIADTRSGIGLATAVFASDPTGALLLEAGGGRPIGVGFFQASSSDAFIGPIAIDPEAQGRGYGKRLLKEILDRVPTRRARLLQDAFNPISFRLYSRAQFEVVETLVLLISEPGGPMPVPFERPATKEGAQVFALREGNAMDVPTIAVLDHAASGIERAALLERVTIRSRSILLDGPDGPKGFACAFPGNGVWVIGPGWAEDGPTMAAIVVGLCDRCVRDRESVAVFAPASRSDLVRPLLDVGFRVSHLVNLMVRGAFRPFAGAYLPVLPVDTTIFD